MTGRKKRRATRVAIATCRAIALCFGVVCSLACTLRLNFAATQLGSFPNLSAFAIGPTRSQKLLSDRSRHRAFIGRSLLPRRGDAYNGPASVGRSAKVGDDVCGLALEEELGAGGFGTTWRARVTDHADPALSAREPGQVVTVKFVPLEAGWRSVDAFEREAKVLARLQHNAIPRYLGSVVNDRPDGRDFGLVYDHIRGTSLDVLVRSGQWVPTPENLRVLTETLLDICVHLASYAPPIVHRDIKPANIVLEKASDEEQSDWRAFLVDFGAAVLGGGAKTTAVGTFGFMAPESFAQVFTPKSDLYSVGATILFAVTGREPGSFPQERLQIQFRDAFVGTVWEREESWLAEFLDRLLAPAPEDRFSSAAEALRFLRQSGVAESSGQFVSRQDALAPEEQDDAGATTYTPPRGSRLKAVRRGFDLKVLLPPPSWADSLPTGAFAVVWTGFVATWTSGVLAAGAPIMALFSIPFWGAGGALLKETLSPLLRGTTEITIGRQRWQYARVGKEKPVLEGKTTDLRCRAEITGYVKRPVGCLVLEEGALEERLGEGLKPVEHEWLAGIISEHVALCGGDNA